MTSTVPCRSVGYCTREPNSMTDGMKANSTTTNERKNIFGGGPRGPAGAASPALTAAGMKRTPRETQKLPYQGQTVEHANGCLSSLDGPHLIRLFTHISRRRRLSSCEGFSHLFTDPPASVTADPEHPF